MISNCPHPKLRILSAEDIVGWIGNGADAMITEALRFVLNHEPLPKQIHDARGLFDRHYASAIKGSQLYAGVIETLRVLAEHAFPLAVVTNKPTQFVAPLLEATGISGYFSLIVGGDDVIAKKPDPASLLLVLDNFGLPSCNLLFVGDSRNDILAAQAAGCPCAGLIYGYNFGQPIESSHPDVVLTHFNQLLPILGL